jgi:hypothetical protein
MSNTRNDQDSPWKEVLRAFFPQAIEFFFPQTAALVDWGRPIEFLDTQLRQITREADVGKRIADLLVKVFLREGQEVWLCLHVEVQGSKEKAFPQRLFVYNFRIFDLFERPAISLAILTDTNRSWRPSEFNFEFPDTRLNFQFGVSKLLDFQPRMAELETSNNPFAIVVLAHLQAQATQKDDLQRKTVKFTLARRLYERGYPRQEVIDLLRFITWVMILPDTLEQQFWQELLAFEEEQNMPYMTSVERLGRQEEACALVLGQLADQVGDLPSAVVSRIQALPLPQVQTLSRALLRFTQLSDLQTWLEQQTQA